jgi:hypothetical protein
LYDLKLLRKHNTYSFVILYSYFINELLLNHSLQFYYIKKRYLLMMVNGIVVWCMVLVYGSVYCLHSIALTRMDGIYIDSLQNFVLRIADGIGVESNL